MQKKNLLNIINIKNLFILNLYILFQVLFFFSLKLEIFYIYFYLRYF